MRETSSEARGIEVPLLCIGAVVLAGWLGLACGEKPRGEPIERVEAEVELPPRAVRLIPEDLPRYPAATLLDMDTETYEEGLTVTFESPDSVDQIRAFYDRELPAAGWEIEVAKRISDAYIIFAHKGEVEANIDVTEGGETTSIEWSLYPYEAE
jgi:hypothetical protein